MRVLAAPAFSNERVNPYNALLYREIQALGAKVEEYSHTKVFKQHYDIAHFHWPDGYIDAGNLLKTLQRVALFMLIVSVLKLRGSRIVWTVHNLAPHDAEFPQISRSVLSWFIHRCDGLIFMTREGKAQFDTTFPAHRDKPWALIPHGHYRHSYSPPIDRNEARLHLGLQPGDKLILLFGMLKEYKNAEGLIRAFGQAAPPGYRLLIAGRPESPGLERRLRQQAQQQHATNLILEFIPDHQVHFYFSAADVTVLPYRDGLNSGAMLLSLSFNIPVIAPSIGAMKDLGNSLGHQWVVNYDGEFNARVLQNSLQLLADQERPPECPLTPYEWHHLGAQTLSFYRTLCDSKLRPDWGKAGKRSNP